MLSIISWQFFLFLLLIAAVYYSIKIGRSWLILIASLAFYYLASNIWASIAFLTLICCNYLFGRAVKKSKMIFIFAIALNVVTLVAVKVWFPSLVFLGISFYTFTQISYLIDIRMGKIEEENNFANYAAYVSFFPKIVAGPIERAGRFMPQLQHTPFLIANIEEGIKLIIFGLFKKVVVSQMISELIAPLFGQSYYSGPEYVLGLALYAFQIYYDFSGYTDIALGAARLFGIRLSINFSMPYLAGSIQEFWRRWHITLSNWFRDYVYIPLGGNRRHHGLNILIVFVLVGLWHGLTSTFIVWGFLQGFYIVGVKTLSMPLSRLKTALGLAFKPLAVLTTFAAGCFAWLFFRASSLDQALGIVTRLSSGWGFGSLSRIESLFGWIPLLIALILILIVEATHYAKEIGKLSFPSFIRWPAFASAAWLVALFILKSGHQAFIYARF